MLFRSLLGLAALLVATSCVPSRIVAPIQARQAVPMTAAETTLLTRLALSDPDGTADAAPVVATPGRPRASMAAPPFAAMTRSGDNAARAVECLTAAVYYEARSEPADGQRAVAQVVLNRVRDRAFPASVCGVVYQRSAKGCQFSFACDGSTAHAIDPAAWRRARAVAEAGFDGAVYAPVGAATYYHTAAVSPWWTPSLARIGQIGAHIFYGWRRAMASALAFRRGYAGIEPIAAPEIARADADDAPVATAVTIHRSEPPSPGLASAVTADGEDHRSQSVILIAGVRIHRGSAPFAPAEADRTAPDGDTRPLPADPI